MPDTLALLLWRYVAERIVIIEDKLLLELIERHHLL